MLSQLMLYNLYSNDGECLETAVMEKDVPAAIAAWESLEGWEKVEARPMVESKEFRTIDEINAEKAWKQTDEFPDNPTEGDLQTLEYFEGK